MAGSSFKQESDIESSLLSLSLKESSANRRSSSTYVNRRSSAAHANPVSPMKPRSVRPPPKKVPPPESDIESSLLSLSLKESSANRRSSSAYLNRRSSAAHANPGSSVKPRSVRPPSKKVPPPGSAVKPCASTVSVRPSRPPFRVLTPGSAVKPCSVSVRPSFRVCGRLPRNFPPPDILCTLTILHALVI
ncbi:proline-rich receptor-like protein kinase PERK9 isoform X3 [Lotus japonicus]|uniref:proline-rich receptor-like protein kinase PERK9 isoform X3 n=1 Tax=Lotus japonicus TaxID=34305 RepID=UPI00258A5D47|nr:proline-rich receptor-like protein kinase PERK9 isoform X3 [Lotus japonicus]